MSPKYRGYFEKEVAISPGQKSPWDFIQELFGQIPMSYMFSPAIARSEAKVRWPERRAPAIDLLHEACAAYGLAVVEKADPVTIGKTVLFVMTLDESRK